MNYTEINNDLDFLSDYWIIAKELGFKIKNELPIIHNNPSKVINIKGSKLNIISYKDLNTWQVHDLIKAKDNVSVTLEALADKIYNMILKGRANDVKPMINRIITRHPSMQIKPISNKEKHRQNFEGWSWNKEPEILGIGHFRWNYQAYTLTKEEIQFLKEYFKL